MNKLTEFEHNFPKKRGKPPSTQLKILNRLGINSATNSQLSESLNKRRQEIKDAIIGLINKKLVYTWCKICDYNCTSYDEWKNHLEDIKHKSNKRKHDHRNLTHDEKKSISENKRFFKLSPNGIYNLITYILSEKQEPNYHFSSQNFWDKIAFDKSFDYEIIKILDDVYKKKILKINTNYVLPQFFLLWISTESDIHRNFLELFVREKSLLLNELMNKFNKPKKTILAHFQNMEFSGLVTQTRSREYALTHIGLIELLSYLYDDFQLELKKINTIHEITSVQEMQFILHLDELDHDQHPKKLTSDDIECIINHIQIFNNSFNSIIRIHGKLLPKIFHSEMVKKFKIKPLEICALLTKLYKKKHDIEFVKFNPNYEQYYENRKILSLLQELFSKNLDEHYRALDAVIDHAYLFDIVIDDSKNTEYVLHGGKTEKELLADINPGLVQYVQKFAIPSTKIKNSFGNERYNMIYAQDDYSLYSDLIEKQITFDFYSILKAYLFGWAASKTTKHGLEWSNRIVIDKDLDTEHNNEMSNLYSVLANYINQKQKELDNPTITDEIYFDECGVDYDVDYDDKKFSNMEDFREG